MGLFDTVSAERIHIGFFGMRNAGKSSLVNAVTGQSLSVVSDVKGTTTDPVTKAMELLPIGPVVIIDTPGYDDEGELGALRVEKTKQILRKTDIAVLVVDAAVGLTDKDRELISLFGERSIPYIIAYNKSDACDILAAEENAISVSAVRGDGVRGLKEKLGGLAKGVKLEIPIVKDLISSGDTVILVTPIDESAPRGRLILPQQLTLREILDAHASAVVCQDGELSSTLENLKNPPKMVITDSQVFGKVASLVPEDVPLTSFSILMARYKGDLKTLVSGAFVIDRLKDGDRVLISEGCTHHRQCNDIGTVKLPRMIEKFTGKGLDFHFTSGGEFPDDTSDFALVVHCGGCMLNEAEMKSRMNKAKSLGTPIVNYGVAIARMSGILERSLAPFGGARAFLEEV